MDLASFFAFSNESGPEDGAALLFLDKQSDEETIAHENPAEGRYRKPVIADGAIVGAIILGRPRDTPAVAAAIKARRDVRAPTGAPRRRVAGAGRRTGGVAAGLAARRGLASSLPCELRRRGPSPSSMNG